MTDIYAPTTGCATDSETLLESYRTYEAVEHAIDHLSDEGFPVEYLRIVGQGVTTVERIDGRMTNGRAALNGAGAGVWTGLLFGMLLALFLPATSMAAILLAAWHSARCGAEHSVSPRIGAPAGAATSSPARASKRPATT